MLHLSDHGLHHLPEVRSPDHKPLGFGFLSKVRGRGGFFHGKLQVFGLRNAKDVS